MIKTSRMRYLATGFVVLILGSYIYTTFFYKGLPEDFKKKIAVQKNPFYMPKDSSDVIWSRAEQYISKRYRLIGGNVIQRSDTQIYIPYYNDYHKGNSLLISRKAIGDSVRFKVYWYYSGIFEEEGSKEVALFMSSGIDQYNYKKR
jgi:hypothetical protein